MIKVRFGTFETNSSSVHSLAFTRNYVKDEESKYIWLPEEPFKFVMKSIAPYLLKGIENEDDVATFAQIRYLDYNNYFNETTDKIDYLLTLEFYRLTAYIFDYPADVKHFYKAVTDLCKKIGITDKQVIEDKINLFINRIASMTDKREEENNWIRKCLEDDSEEYYLSIKDKAIEKYATQLLACFYMLAFNERKWEVFGEVSCVKEIYEAVKGEGLELYIRDKYDGDMYDYDWQDVDSLSGYVDHQSACRASVFLEENEIGLREFLFNNNVLLIMDRDG